MHLQLGANRAALGGTTVHPLVTTVDEQTGDHPLPVHAHDLGAKKPQPISFILFEVLKNYTC